MLNKVYQYEQLIREELATRAKYIADAQKFGVAGYRVTQKDIACIDNIIATLFAKLDMALAQAAAMSF